MLANWVKETTATTGTGTLTLAGRVDTFAAFTNALSNLSVVRYMIEASNGDREEGVGTFTTSGLTLSRDKILSTWDDSTTTYLDTNPTAISLPSGTHTVTISATAGGLHPVAMGRRNGTRIISADIPHADASDASTLTLNRHYTIPFLLTETVVATKLGIYIVTGVDGSTTRLGISRMGDDSLGIDMLEDVTISATTTQNSTSQEGSFTARTLTPAWYMVHFNSTGGIRVGITAVNRNPAAYPLAIMNSTTRLFPAAFQHAVSSGGAFNTPQSQTTVSTSNTARPLIWLST